MCASLNSKGIGRINRHTATLFYQKIGGMITAELNKSYFGAQRKSNWAL
jgi:hypothetical protein